MSERVKVEAKKPEVKRDNVNSQMQGSGYTRSMDAGVERILYLQRTVGNQAVSRLMRSRALQAKLRIGQPGDVYEQEADRVADAVMRMPEPGVQRQEEPEEEEETLQIKPLVDQITPLIQRQVEEEEEEEILQAKSTEDATPEVSNDLESQINAIKGGGRPLAESERDYFEPWFGADFSQVRVHTDTQADESARAVNARAFTVGQDVVFDAGEYSPENLAGKRLLTHELAHVVQHLKKPHIPTVQRWPRDVLGERILTTQQRRRFKWPILEAAIDRYAGQYTVPANFLRGIIHFETLERGSLETIVEPIKIKCRDWSVSLGPGDVQVRRAADVLYPGRDWLQNPLTPQEFNHIVRQLGTPDDHARILAITMQDNFRHYGRKPGKTSADRWRFAIARHKTGHIPVGVAQVRARKQAKNINSWSDVSQYMDEGTVQFVNNASGYTDARLRRNPYD